MPVASDPLVMQRVESVKSPQKTTPHARLLPLVAVTDPLVMLRVESVKAPNLSPKQAPHPLTLIVEELTVTVLLEMAPGKCTL